MNQLLFFPSLIYFMWMGDPQNAHIKKKKKKNQNMGVYNYERKINLS